MDRLDRSGSEHDSNTIEKNRVPNIQYWCFTLNNYTELDRLDLEKLFTKKGYKFVIGEEVGESGTPHLQGFVNCGKRTRLPEVVRNRRIHWERTKAGEAANVKYCTKEGKYTTNMLTEATKRRKLGIIEELNAWQDEAVKTLLSSSEREILWRWDPVGNTGKTALAKWLIYEHKALLIDGKKADILHGATEYIKTIDEDTLFDRPMIFILDMSRTVEQYVSYDAIEKLKNGCWYSGKYEGGMIMIPPPKVIIFANFRPDMAKLSRDRWNIRRVANWEEIDIADEIEKLQV